MKFFCEPGIFFLSCPLRMQCILSTWMFSRFYFLGWCAVDHVLQAQALRFIQLLPESFSSVCVRLLGGSDLVLLARFALFYAAVPAPLPSGIRALKPARPWGVLPQRRQHSPYPTTTPVPTTSSVPTVTGSSHHYINQPGSMHHAWHGTPAHLCKVSWPSLFWRPVSQAREVKLP